MNWPQLLAVQELKESVISKIAGAMGARL